MILSNKIKILSPEQAIKIAAGEVVERPVNIIKEILENSIDAQATKISIFICKAGKQLIKIIDNGCGMSPDDAKLSVMQHATSKITSVEDLESIATFGFRGEALASVNAVSNMRITTKTAEEQTGIKFAWNFGTLIEESLQSHPTGTTIEITNLFDNIPARQKFLKKDETEWRAITTLFQAFCLDYPTIHFQLYNENKLQFNCPTVNNVTDRAAQLFDIQLQKNTSKLVVLENKLCSVTGIISAPNYYRYDRNQIFIFVNNRWIKNIDLTKAIMRGYAGTLPPQKYPAAIVFITIHTDQVDVNIHPKKEEVKFLHPKKVESVIVNSIKATLDISLSLKTTPSKTVYQNFQPTFLEPAHSSAHQEIEASFNFLKKEKLNVEKNISNFQASNLNYNPTSIENFDQIFEQKTNNSPMLENSLKEEIIMPPTGVRHYFEPASIVEEEVKQESHLQEETAQDFSIIGQYKKTYILFEKNENLFFVDQHAAHERILYEQFKDNFKNIATIQLMFPEFIKLLAQDILTIAPYLQLLEKHGVVAQIFSDTQLIIQATPVHLKSQLLSETIQQFIGWIKEIDEIDQARIALLLDEKVHTKMACSAAIKAGDILNIEQMQQLLKSLNTTEHRFSCPHGRPTLWTLPLDTIEKKFKRDYGKKAEQLFDFL